MGEALTARRLQPDALADAIKHAVAQTRLAYQFSPGSYSFSAFNAVLALAQIYERERAVLDLDAVRRRLIGQTAGRFDALMVRRIATLRAMER